MASWRGFWLRFTDGICPECLQRFRTEHRELLERRQLAEAQHGDAQHGEVGTSSIEAA